MNTVPDDRFTTNWAGPLDKRALEWAATTELSPICFDLPAPSLAELSYFVMKLVGYTISFKRVEKPAGPDSERSTDPVMQLSKSLTDTIQDLILELAHILFPLRGHIPLVGKSFDSTKTIASNSIALSFICMWRIEC